MADMLDSLQNIRLMDDFGKRDSPVHKIHPLVKFIATILYLGSIVSFNKYEVIALLPFIIYPVLVFVLSGLPYAPILKRILLIEPFIIGIGILNPFFDKSPVLVGGMVISGGWLVFLSIIIKSTLTVTAGMLLIAVTGMDNLAQALRAIKIPKIFILQLLLTYRYIAVLIEEVYRMKRAYLLRAPGQKSISVKAWGSFVGQLLLRTYDRAQRVYQSMIQRGFTGEYQSSAAARVTPKDIVYLTAWGIFFVLARMYNIPVLLSALLGGVVV